MVIVRTEHEFSKGWIENNPELFTARVEKIFRDYPKETHNVVLKPGLMPGMFMRLVAIRKDV